MLLRVGAPQGRRVVAGSINPAAFNSNCRTAHRPTFARSSRPEVVEYPIYESNINKAAPLVPDLRSVLVARGGKMLSRVKSRDQSLKSVGPAEHEHSQRLREAPEKREASDGTFGKVDIVSRQANLKMPARWLVRA
ncbi:hypothetical protein FB451DRAFT_1189788 [Mycena latifolia]|nr:hypothetical protein FB451DRAFT_1189788 [Mycena latifolia]